MQDSPCGARNARSLAACSRMERAATKRSAVAGFGCAAARVDMETEYREAAEVDVSAVTKSLDPFGTGRSLQRRSTVFFAVPHTFCPGAIFFSGSLALRGKLWSNKGRIGGASSVPMRRGSGDSKPLLRRLRARRDCEFEPGRLPGATGRKSFISQNRRRGNDVLRAPAAGARPGIRPPGVSRPSRRRRVHHAQRAWKAATEGADRRTGSDIAEPDRVPGGHGAVTASEKPGWPS